MKKLGMTVVGKEVGGANSCSLTLLVE